MRTAFVCLVIIGFWVISEARPLQQRFKRGLKTKLEKRAQARESNKDDKAEKMANAMLAKFTGGSGGDAAKEEPGAEGEGKAKKGGKLLGKLKGSGAKLKGLKLKKHKKKGGEEDASEEEE